MTFSMNDPWADTDKAIRAAIESKLPDAAVEVSGSGGHFEIHVEAAHFQDKSTLERQRIVYGAISHLISGENAPVHAVDKIATSVPRLPKEGTKEAAAAGKAAQNGTEIHDYSAKLVTITASAQAEVKRLLEAEGRADLGLRLGIKGGGCSGLTYSLEFTEHREGDTVLDYNGFCLFLDRKSTVYLSGITLDHSSGLSGRGFVFRNPLAASTCGCGESFSL